MRSFRKFSILAALALVGCCGLSACYIDATSDNCVKRYQCDYVCSERTYVDTVCSGIVCWDEVKVVQECGDVCSSYYEECYTDVCYRDRDCGYGEYCSNGTCHAVNSGSVRLCESCGSSADCYGVDNSCVLLQSGEQVCLAGCRSDADCGTGYTCRSLGAINSNKYDSVCVPNNESCDPNYCASDLDCDENGTCVDNRCQLEITNLNECQENRECMEYYEPEGLAEYALCINSVDENGNKVSYCSLSCYADDQCGKGYSCYLRAANDLSSGACYRSNERSCVHNDDCGESGMVCSNGRCMVSCLNEGDCASGGGYFKCISGVCKYDY